MQWVTFTLLFRWLLLLDMAGRGGPLPLQTLARDETCRITLNSINNILVQDKLHYRKQTLQCIRKRSRSCSDSTEVNPPTPKKLRIAEDQHASSTDARRKRSREPEHDDDDFTHRKRRKESDGPSQGRDGLVPIPTVYRQKHCSRDDEAVRYRVSGSEKLEALKNYFSCITPSMWTAFGSSLLDRAIRKVRFEFVDDRFLGKTLEHIFCEKLLSFSTASVENYLSSLETTLFDKLIKCVRLVVLEVTVVPQNDRNLVAASLALQRLGHLHSLSLLPSSRYSYHWAVSHIACHCQALRELKIVYDGDLLNNVNGLTCLQKCSKMTSLWLFNFGRKTETEELSQLMSKLQKLKVLFHKELPNAVMGLQGANTDEQATVSGTERQLALERVDLCWYQRAVGYQLVYVPSSYLLKVAKVCPQIRVLNLVNPPCLAKVVKTLPNLHVLVLQQASLTSCLACTLSNLGLINITEIRVTDVCDVTHDIISALARGCPHLQVLNIINSSLLAQGDLQIPTHRQPFPCLRQVTLVPVMIHGRPSLTNPSTWQFGAQLTSYLLGGATQLTSIHLHYKQEDILDGDLPTAQLLESVFSCHRPALRSLLLEWPPAISPGLVGAVVRACPALMTLASILTWPLTSHQRAAIVTRYGRYTDIT